MSEEEIEIILSAKDQVSDATENVSNSLDKVRESADKLDPAFSEAERAAKDLDGVFNNVEDAGESLADQLEDIEDAIEDLDDKVDEVAENTGKLNTGMVNAAAAGDLANQSMQGLSDVLAFAGEQFGLPVEGAAQMTSQFASLGGGVAALATSVPQMIPALGTMTASIWANTAALLANPLVIGAVAFVAIVAGIVLIVKHWDTLTEKIPFLGTAFEKVMTVVGPAIEFVKTAVSEVLSFVQANWPKLALIISGPFAPLVILATDMFGIRSAITGAISNTIDFVKSHWKEIATVISGPFAPLVILATDAFGIRSALEEAFSSMVDKITGLAEDVMDGAKSGFTSVYDSVIHPWFIALPQKILDAMSTFGQDLYDFAKDAFDAGTGFLGGIVSKFFDVKDYVASIPGKILDSIGDLSNTLFQVGWDLVTGLFSGITSKFTSGIGAVTDMLNPTNWDVPWGSPFPDGMYKQAKFAGEKFNAGLSDSLHKVVPEVISPWATDLGEKLRAESSRAIDHGIGADGLMGKIDKTKGAISTTMFPNQVDWNAYWNSREGQAISAAKNDMEAVKAAHLRAGTAFINEGGHFSFDDYATKGTFRSYDELRMTQPGGMQVVMNVENVNQADIDTLASDLGYSINDAMRARGFA